MQISEDLVKYITSELMKRLSLGAPLAPSPRPLLLVGSRNDLSTPLLARLQQCFELSEHTQWDSPIPPKAAILITKLNIQALIRVAEGDEGCTVEGRALLAALLNGQPVAALKDGLAWRAYRHTAPPALLARYGQCENILSSYGLKLVDEDGVLEALAPNAVPHITGGSTDFIPNTPQLASSGAGRKVLTESDLLTLCPASKGFGQILSLGLGDILTPLAKDYVLAMKIKVAKA
ncbi:MAG: hypothetical protein ACRCTY_01200 [Candidatus Adiutrix sp.]